MKKIEDIADIVELQTWASEKPTSVSSIKEGLEAILDNAADQNPEDLAQNIIDEFITIYSLSKNRKSGHYHFETFYKSPSDRIGAGAGRIACSYVSRGVDFHLFIFGQ